MISRQVDTYSTFDHLKETKQNVPITHCLFIFPASSITQINLSLLFCKIHSLFLVLESKGSIISSTRVFHV